MATTWRASFEDSCDYQRGLETFYGLHGGTSFLCG